MDAPTRGEYRPEDEIANFITHGFGVILSLIATWVLIHRLRRIDSVDLQVAGGIYAMSLVGVYSASTLSHAFYDLKWRRFFRTIDQSLIFVLIAGSYTPFAIVYGPNRWWTPMLIIEWGIACVGVFLCIRLRNLPGRLKLLYGIQGWLPAMSLGIVLEKGPDGIEYWIVAGGLSYTFGAIFLVYDHLRKYFHAVWHLLVIIGSVCHYIAILMILNP